MTVALGVFATLMAALWALCSLAVVVDSVRGRSDD